MRSRGSSGIIPCSKVEALLLASQLTNNLRERGKGTTSAAPGEGIGILTCATVCWEGGGKIFVGSSMKLIHFFASPRKLFSNKRRKTRRNHENGEKTQMGEFVLETGSLVGRDFKGGNSSYSTVYLIKGNPKVIQYQRTQAEMRGIK